MPTPSSATDGLKPALLKSSVRISCWRLPPAVDLLALGTLRGSADGEAGDDGGERVSVDVRAVDVLELRGVTILGLRCCCGDCSVGLEASLVDRRGEYGSKWSYFGP